MPEIRLRHVVSCSSQDSVRHWRGGDWKKKGISEEGSVRTLEVQRGTSWKSKEGHGGVLEAKSEFWEICGIGKLWGVCGTSGEKRSRRAHT
jgi:hypothetical protein